MFLCVVVVSWWGPSFMSECYLRGPTLVAEYCYDSEMGRPFFIECCCVLMLVRADEGCLLWLNVVVNWWGPFFMTQCCFELMRTVLYKLMLLFADVMSWWGPPGVFKCRDLTRVVLIDWMPLWPAGGSPFWLKVVVCCWCCHELMRAAPYDWVHLLSDK